MITQIFGNISFIHQNSQISVKMFISHQPALQYDKNKSQTAKNSNIEVNSLLQEILQKINAQNIELKQSVQDNKSLIFEIVLGRYNEILRLKLFELQKQSIWVFEHVKELKLGNSNIENVQMLQFVSWKSLRVLQLPFKATNIKGLNKCIFGQLQSIDMGSSKSVDFQGLYRMESKKLIRMKIPQSKSNQMGKCLKYLKMESISKKDLYLNYLKRIPQKYKCIQEQYIQFQMEYFNED